MSRESNKGINFHKIKNKAFWGDPSKVHREIKKDSHLLYTTGKWGTKPLNPKRG